jgi:hypothetical protein
MLVTTTLANQAMDTRTHHTSTTAWTPRDGELSRLMKNDIAHTHTLTVP